MGGKGHRGAGVTSLWEGYLLRFSMLACSLAITSRLHLFMGIVMVMAIVTPTVVDTSTMTGFSHGYGPSPGTWWQG